MIETHDVNALLNSSLREGSFFAVLNFINGLVAPSFLFWRWFRAGNFSPSPVGELHPAGATFLAIPCPVRFHPHRRILFASPVFSFSRLKELTDGQAWSSLFQADILQVIAVTLRRWSVLRFSHGRKSCGFGCHPSLPQPSSWSRL